MTPFAPPKSMTALNGRSMSCITWRVPRSIEGAPLIPPWPLPWAAKSGLELELQVVI